MIDSLALSILETGPDHASLEARHNELTAKVDAMTPPERADWWADMMMNYVPTYMRLAKAPEKEIERWAPKMIVHLIKTCIGIDFDDGPFLARAAEDLKFSRKFKEGGKA